MKSIRSIITVLGCIALLTGCGFQSLRDPQTVGKKYRVSLNEQLQEGKWISKDIQLAYKCHLQSPNKLELSADLTFDNYLVTGFDVIEHFSLSILFLNAEGMVIGRKPIYMVIGNQPLDQLMRFDRSIALPEGTKAFSFSYSGKVNSNSNDGGSSSWDIFF